MLKRLTLKNFRQHEDRTIDLTAGLNVVRGANEAGKSTLIEAIAYALFGSKACREPLAQIVTWGKDENTLRVELLLASDGVEYTFTRSPKGAEVNYPGGRVVGQAQVSAKAQELLGSDPAVAGKLMLSSQGSIRGALAEGATKTMKLIEDLADFDVIDYLIELLQNKYVTGPTLTAEDRLTRAEAALKVAQEAALAPDTAALAHRVSQSSNELRKLQGSVDQLIKPAYEKARGNLNAAEGALKQRQGLQESLQHARQGRAKRLQEREAAVAASKLGVDPKALEAAREAVQRAQGADAQRDVWRACSALKLPETHWEGDRASFDEQVAIAIRGTYELRLSITQWQEQQKALVESYYGHGSKCKACGQALPDAAAIEAHNREVDAKVKALDVALATARRHLVAAEGDLADLRAVEKAAQPFYAFLARYPDINVSANDTTVPPSLVWNGPVPEEVNVANLRRILANLEQAEKDAAAARVRSEMLGCQLDDDDQRIAMLQQQIEDCSYADKLPEARAAFEAAERAYNDALTQLTLLRAEKAEAESQIKALQAAHEQAKRGVALAETSVAVARGELDDLIFNNALLKRIKTARPMIADKLWNIVLTAVSTYFSSMRGTRSMVTRQGNQFLVDGKPVEGLSGSTLDILGLAIRLALTKTFLPMAPFLILDEPAAAMDDSRTQSTLGFLVASGFTQTLLVTHDEQSESVADNLITI
jgi:exonuclease SbcC